MSPTQRHLQRVKVLTVIAVAMKTARDAKPDLGPGELLMTVVTLLLASQVSASKIAEICEGIAAELRSKAASLPGATPTAAGTYLAKPMPLSEGDVLQALRTIEQAATPTAMASADSDEGRTTP